MVCDEVRVFTFVLLGVLFYIPFFCSYDICGGRLQVIFSSSSCVIESVTGLYDYRFQQEERRPL